MNIDPQLLQLLSQQQPEQMGDDALLRVMNPGKMKSPKLSDDWWSQLHKLPEFQDVLRDHELKEALPGQDQFNGTINPEMTEGTPRGRVIDPNEFKLPMADQQSLGLDPTIEPNASQGLHNKEAIEAFLQQLRRHLYWKKGENL